jgi:WD40 repeat protein
MADKEEHPQGPHWLDITERIGKLASIIAIPIVIPLALAFYSAKVQQNSQKETINRDYVQLAVSILNQKKDNANEPLRNWAVDLLAEHSPTKFEPEVIAALKSGSISLPNASSNTITLISPDGRIVANAIDDNVLIGERHFRTPPTLLHLSKSVVAMAFSQDIHFLAVATTDGDVSIFDPLSYKLMRKLSGQQDVDSVQFDSANTLRIIGEDSIWLYDLSDGRLISRTAISSKHQT